MDTKDKDEAQALANRIIDALGGTAKTAAFFDTSESAVSQWRTNGISSPRLAHLKAVRPDLLPAPRKPPSRRKAEQVTPP